jgi:zinc protease
MSQVALLAGVVVSSFALVQAKTTKPAVTVEPRKWEWEQDGADLKPDERFHFGACKNGLRYVWLENKTPPKEVMLRLHVDVGSLMENEQELGIAHFTEHMAFNGTTNFKAGTLVDTFQKQGVKFGHDVNASTGFDATTYELDLPDTDPARLKNALLWFRDIACGLKMEQSEVQAEKGVVDSEQRDRDSEGFRNFVEEMGQLLDGTLYPKRLPIGVKSVRDKFNQKLCLGFYKKWYRPENMTFVLVGDLGGVDPTKMIEDNFGSIPVPKDPATPRPDLGKPTFKTKAIQVKNGGGFVAVGMLRPGVDEPYSSKTFARSVPLQIAQIMADRRFAARQQKEKLPYGGVGATDAGSNPVFQTFGMVDGPAIVVQCSKDKWKEALTAAERELRRMLDRSFTGDEVNEAYAQYNTSRLVPRPRFQAISSGEFVNDLLNACGGRYVPMEERAEKEALGAAARTVHDPAMVTKALKDEWSKGELVFLYGKDIPLGTDPAGDLLAVWNAAKATDLDQPMAAPADATTAKAEPDKPKDAPAGTNGADKPEEKKPEKEKKKVDPSTFAYAQPDVIRQPDTVETLERLKDLRVVTMKFKNGVLANYRGQASGEIPLGHFEVRVGEGESRLDPSRHAVATVADQVFLQLGLAKNDWDVVSAVGGGGVDFTVEGDALVFKGMTYDGDVKRQLEIVCAYLSDPGFRKDAWDEWKKERAEREAKKNKAGADGSGDDGNGDDENGDKKDEPKKDDKKDGKKDGDKKDDKKPKKENIGSLIRNFQKLVLAGDPRLVEPAPGAIDQVTFEEVKAFVQPQLDGPVSVTVTGVSAEKAERALFSTLGKLPQRRASQLDASRCTIAALKSGLKEKHTVETGAASALIHVLYPSPDELDPVTARKLDLIEDVVNDRLLKEIREKRGGAYSPHADHWASDSWRGLGWFTLDVEVDPAKVDEMSKACVATMELLGTKGVTQDELNRLRTAHVGGIEQTLKNPELWFSQLRYALARPEIYSDLANFKTIYDKITVADLNALCKTIFVKGKEDVFVAAPPGSTPTPPPKK